MNYEGLRLRKNILFTSLSGMPLGSRFSVGLVPNFSAVICDCMELSGQELTTLISSKNTEPIMAGRRGRRQMGDAAAPLGVLEANR